MPSSNKIMEKVEKNIKSFKSVLIADKKGEGDKINSINSRVFLPSSQCMGSRSHYLFAFGGE